MESEDSRFLTFPRLGASVLRDAIVRQVLSVVARVLIWLLISMVDGGTFRAKTSHRVEEMVNRNARRDDDEGKEEKMAGELLQRLNSQDHCKDGPNGRRVKRG